jgi:replicative DNA helicase
MSEYHSIESEQQLLGAVLMNNTAFSVVDDIVESKHFFEPIHRDIWEVCASLIRMGKLCSPLTLKTFLPADVKIGSMDLREYVALLAAEATTIVNAPDFARLIRDMADRRTIIEVGTELTQSREADNLALSAWAVDYLDGIVAAQSMSGAPALNMDQAVVRAIDAAAAAFQRDGKPRGLPYGLRALDDRTLGAMPGDLVVIAGRPGMGKTAFALSVLRNQALDANRCLFVSLEMGDVALTTRMISDQIWRPNRRLSYWQISSGKFREERFREITDAGRELAALPIRIEQQPGLTVAQIGARARQYKRRHGLKALFVDHLGLVKPSGRYSGNKVNETGEITMGLKSLAKELGIPVYLLCQINRGVEQREDKRPSLSDLRNSGDIEQDADTVLILYRPAYYLAKREPAAGSAEFIIWSDEMNKVESRLDVAIEKQRSGPVGTVRLHCDIACNAVRDEISEMDDSLMLPGEKMENFV